MKKCVNNFIGIKDRWIVGQLDGCKRSMTCNLLTCLIVINHQRGELSLQVDNNFHQHFSIELQFILEKCVFILQLNIKRNRTTIDDGQRCCGWAEILWMLVNISISNWPNLNCWPNERVAIIIAVLLFFSVFLGFSLFCGFAVIVIINHCNHKITIVNCNFKVFETIYETLLRQRYMYMYMYLYFWPTL